jgi:hypothetical protein
MINTGYEPGVSSDSVLELAKGLTLKYAVLPHSGDWGGARVVGRALVQPAAHRNCFLSARREAACKDGGLDRL